MKPRLTSLLCLSFLALAVGWTYANVYSGQFVYDDEFLIVKNRFLLSFHEWPRLVTSCSTAGAGFTDSFFRPLQGTAYLFVRQLLGPKPWGFHLLNVVLHGLNTLMLFALGRRLGLNRWAATLGSLVWAVHPVHVEAVTYMSATADPLHAAFLLSGVLTVLNHKPTDRWPRRTLWLGLGLLAYLGAIFSKESGIVFPALLVAVLFRVREPRWHWKTYQVTWLYWLTAFVYLCTRQLYLNFNNDFDFYKAHNLLTDSVLIRFYTALATLPHYLALLVWPAHLSIDRLFFVYPTPWAWAVIGGAVIVVAGITLTAVALRQKASQFEIWCAWIFLWCLAAHFPQTGILVPMNSLFLEHWMYLPTMGVILGLAGMAQSLLLAQSFWRPLAEVIVTLAIAVGLGMRTWNQSEVWLTPVSLFRHVVEQHPEVARAHHNLAMALTDVGEYDQALEQYKLALGMSEPYVQTYHNMGLLYLTKGDRKTAEEYFLKSLALDPHFVATLEALVKFYESAHDPAHMNYFANQLRESRPK